jgi:hypothetical protein
MADVLQMLKDISRRLDNLERNPMKQSLLRYLEGAMSLADEDIAVLDRKNSELKQKYNAKTATPAEIARYKEYTESLARIHARMVDLCFIERAQRQIDAGIDHHWALVSIYKWQRQIDAYEQQPMAGMRVDERREIEEDKSKKEKRVVEKMRMLREQGISIDSMEEIIQSFYAWITENSFEKTVDEFRASIASALNHPRHQ